jgi:hypothetical protein
MAICFSIVFMYHNKFAQYWFDITIYMHRNGANTAFKQQIWRINNGFIIKTTVGTVYA